MISVSKNAKTHAFKELKQTWKNVKLLKHVKKTSIFDGKVQIV
jgi:hypothetical protein